jgi:hypothetical protein
MVEVCSFDATIVAVLIVPAAYWSVKVQLHFGRSSLHQRHSINFHLRTS